MVERQKNHLKQTQQNWLHANWILPNCGEWWWFTLVKSIKRSPFSRQIPKIHRDDPMVGGSFSGLSEGNFKVQVQRYSLCLWCGMILLMEEIRLTSWYGKYPVIYRVLYIPGGAGFLPSTASITKMRKVRLGRLSDPFKGEWWLTKGFLQIILPCPERSPFRIIMITNPRAWLDPTNLKGYIYIYYTT